MHRHAFNPFDKVHWPQEFEYILSTEKREKRNADKELLIKTLQLKSPKDISLTY